jgi:hypothetical protein
MHPLLLSEEGGRPLLTLRRLGNDHEEFATHTPCGKPMPGGKPARETLKMELTMLSKISGRDFVRELNAPSL